MRDTYQTYNIALALNIAASFIIGFFGFLVYRSIKRYNQESLKISKQYEELRNNQEKILLESQLEVREETFQYISKEIHDNIIQTLSLAQLTLNAVDRSPENPDDNLQHLKTVRELQSKAITDLNYMSKSLDSDLIDSHGLIVAIQFEIDRWQKIFGNKIALVIEGEPIHYDNSTELFIFRIIQEAISNGSRHSGARNMIIVLKYAEDQTCVTIEDNGKGFDKIRIYDDKNPARMSGLKNMKKRTELLGGQFDIQTKEGQGTSISVTIPKILWEK